MKIAEEAKYGKDGGRWSGQSVFAAVAVTGVAVSAIWAEKEKIEEKRLREYGREDKFGKMKYATFKDMEEVGLVWILLRTLDF